MRWASGTRAGVVIPMGYAADHRIVVSLMPHGEQRARVTLNGAPLGDFPLQPGWKEYELVARRNLWRPGGNLLEFQFSRAFSPGPRDLRTLSVMFDNLWVVPGNAAVDRLPRTPAVSVVSLGNQTLAEAIGENSVCLDDRAFLVAAYHELYGRGLDPKGEQYFMARLKRGHTREDVARTMMRSPEFRR